MHPVDLLARAQNLRGACALARGDPTTAKACYTEALVVAERLSLPVETGRAQTALAQLEQAEVGERDRGEREEDGEERSPRDRRAEALVRAREHVVHRRGEGEVGLEHAQFLAAADAGEELAANAQFLAGAAPEKKSRSC